MIRGLCVAARRRRDAVLTNRRRRLHRHLVRGVLLLLGHSTHGLSHRLLSFAGWWLLWLWRHEGLFLAALRRLLHMLVVAGAHLLRLASGLPQTLGNSHVFALVRGTRRRFLTTVDDLGRNVVLRQLLLILNITALGRLLEACGDV